MKKTKKIVKPKKKVAKAACIPDVWNTTEKEVTAIFNGNLDLQEAWEKLRAFGKSLGPQRIYPSAKAIMFSTKVCYFYARPKKTLIEVWIFLPRKIEGLQAMQVTTTKEKYSNLFKLIHADQVEEPLTDWIREAFQFASHKS